MAITDADGVIYYRYIYDTYGELSDITTDEGISLKSSEQLTEYRLAELAHATGIDYLYNGQFGVETDQNGLYYMRARYYNQDIKRFINRDIVSGDITNSQSLNRYCYVQGDPVSLTDPFGLCPDPNSNFKDFCKFLNNADWNALGHAALDVAGIFWEGADVINALWYAMEGNTEMAIASAIFAIPGLGIGVGNLMMKSDKLATAGKAVNAISKMTQSGMGIASGISIAKIGFTNMLNSIEAGEFNSGDLAMLIGGMAISAISGKGLVSSGKGLMDVLDGAGKTSKAGKGYLTDSDVNSMPINDNKTRLKYTTSNGLQLNATPGRTTTVLGTYRSDTRAILEELGNTKSLDFGPREGGFNLLNTPDELYVTPEQFWNQYNRPWLDNAIARDDIIKIATEPTWDNLTRINNMTGKIELTGFGREYTYLRKHGYYYDSVTKTMTKGRK